MILKLLFLLWSVTTVIALEEPMTKDNREELPSSDESTSTLPSVNLAPVKGCGFRNPNGLASTRHPGSNETQYGEFPWVTALVEVNSGTYLGVGVIIHPRVVMTVAHIVYRFQGHLAIRAGVWNLTSGSDPLERQDVIVTVIRTHDGFKNDSQNVAYDIALLLLDQPLELADHINVVCLPEQNETFEGYKDCVANGWGKDIFGSELSQILKKVELDMVSTSSCNEQIGKWMPPGFNLHESIVCASRPGQDMCQGDGGAPLACPTGQDRYKLSGLAVSGIDCFQLPGLYTQVSIFRQWIDDVLASWNLAIPTPFRDSA